MPRKGTVDRLPPEIRDLIGKLREQDGYTLDDILLHLRRMEVDVSRSALGRYVRGMDELGEKLRRSRAVAEGLVRQLGDAPESKTARLNIELVHTAILDLFRNAEAGGDGVDADGKAALAGNPQGAMMLAKALEHLTKASRHDVEYIAQAEKRAGEKARRAALEEAAQRASNSAREAGLSAAAAAQLRRDVLGLRTPGTKP
jgi:hypothetical protein